MGVIDECDSCLDSHHVFGKPLCLDIIERHFVALVQEHSRVVDDAVTFLGRRSRSFPLVKQCESTQLLHQYQIVLSDG